MYSRHTSRCGLGGAGQRHVVMRRAAFATGRAQAAPFPKWHELCFPHVTLQAVRSLAYRYSVA